MAGEVVAVPTETVYGLAANAFNEGAVAKIFSIKGRPSFNPIIVHIASWEQSRECVKSWTAEAEALGRKFWPGALTLVLAKSSRVPEIVTAGGDTVGIRWPSHPFMQALIQKCGFPLAAPSANLSNQVSPTTTEHVLQQLHGNIALIVDAGPSVVGIESTVVDLTATPPRVLRPGMISAKEIFEALRLEGGQAAHKDSEAVFKSPGMQPRHYAPRAQVRIIRWQSEAELLAQVEESHIAPERIHIIAHNIIPRNVRFGRISVIPEDPEAYARALYAEMHRADQDRAELILVEEVPKGHEWEGIRDRLRRAASR
jgi:L-threonylcarbamoyladenylate synthase